jgi:zinc protease
MRLIKIYFLALFIFINWNLTLIAQEDLEESGYELNQYMPQDSMVTVGKLENGLTFYIRENKKPEKRAELRLIVNAGSILEDDDQLGLAHFVEHMAFDGTKNFPKQEIINYLESIGLNYGSDLNASTSYDETEYYLQIPTDSNNIIDKSIQILFDWSHNISFNKKEVDRERKVIMEELRENDMGPDARLSNHFDSVMYANSQYLHRKVIGTKHSLETFELESLVRFYKDWYRPDLMAVIVVGDFDKTYVENLINKYFSQIKPVVKPRERKMFLVPDRPGSVFTYYKDPELTNTSIEIHYQKEADKYGTIGYFIKSIVNTMFKIMLNDRLYELIYQNPDPPYISAELSSYIPSRTKKDIYFNLDVKDTGLECGITTLMREIKRIKDYGFTETELDREKKNMAKSYYNSFREKDNIESKSFAEDYISNFIYKSSISSMQYKYELSKNLIKNVSLEEINNLTEKYFTDDNRIISISSPKKDIINKLSNEKINEIIEYANSITSEPYIDKIASEPLISQNIIPGKIVDEHNIDEIGVKEWILSNGIKIVVKQTDFKKDEILFVSSCPGGSSLAQDSIFYSADNSAEIVSHSGLGSFDDLMLEKKLTGIDVNVNPYINSLNEGLYGSASPDDLETLFDLIYLSYTSPRIDTLAFNSLKSRLLDEIEHRGSDPKTAFWDTIDVTLNNYNYRCKPVSKDIINNLDLNIAFEFYKEHFFDASGNVFFFIGAIDTEKLRPLVENYIASLPSVNKEKKWIDNGIRIPNKIIAKNVIRGKDPQSEVYMNFHGPIEWNLQENLNIYALSYILDMKLRDNLRMKTGATYSSDVSASVNKYPYQSYEIEITFSCAPEKVDELTTVVFSVIDTLKSKKVNTTFLEKTKEYYHREREVDIKTNEFWYNTLANYYFNGDNPKLITEYLDRVDSITLDAIQECSKKYLDEQNYVEVRLFPENAKKSNSK